MMLMAVSVLSCVVVHAAYLCSMCWIKSQLRTAFHAEYGRREISNLRHWWKSWLLNIIFKFTCSNISKKIVWIANSNTHFEEFCICQSIAVVFKYGMLCRLMLTNMMNSYFYVLFLTYCLRNKCRREQENRSEQAYESPWSIERPWQFLASWSSHLQRWACDARALTSECQR